MKHDISDGEPFWIDMSVPDAAASSKFYAHLFDWEYEDSGAETGHYTTFFIGDKRIGAIAQAPEQQSWWTPYFKVRDIEATVKIVKENGGVVNIAPTNVFGMLTMAVITAPDGVTFSLAQPHSHPGIQAWKVDGAIFSLTLLCDSTDILDFYRECLGWNITSDTIQAGPNREPFAKVHVMDATQRPPDSRPSWVINIQVPNVDEVAAKATDIGGTVVIAPTELPGIGRTAFITDDNGAGFSVVTPATS